VLVAIRNRQSSIVEADHVWNFAMFGISLSRCHIPEVTIQQHQLTERIVRRSKESDEEVLFVQQHDSPILPVWVHGQLRVLPWGNQRKNSKLPKTHWCREESLIAGNWGWLHPIEVEIPAIYGWDNGVWYVIRQGIRGILINEHRGASIVYPISKPATHYYQVMVRNRRMPAFVGETI